MRDKNQYFPIIPCPVQVGAISAIFYLADKEIEVSAPKSLMHDILKTCSGEKTTEEVIEILSKNWQSILVREFLKHLRQVGIICNSLSISNYIWPFVKNPTRFVHDLSDEEILQLVRKAHKRHGHSGHGILLSVKPSRLQSAIERRRTIRVFSQKDVSQYIIARLLWAGYGILQSSLTRTPKCLKKGGENDEGSFSKRTKTVLVVSKRKATR